MTLRGSQKVAVLLCKFGAQEPNPRSFYEDLFVKRGSGGLNDYWMAASLGAINLDGSEVFGWKTLDTTNQAFQAAHPTHSEKIQAAIAAHNLDAKKFVGVVVIFDVNVGAGGGTGGVVPTGSVLAAQPRDVQLTWLAHETGHMFGLEHSFDHSPRKLRADHQEGEYFDRYDIMSAENVFRDAGHRFSPRGPLLNAANLDRMGWLPDNRVWRPVTKNSSASYEVTLVALEHPGVPGYLALKAAGFFVEFRIPAGFDNGLPRPAVLLHQPAEPNSYIVASDRENYVNEWQPGQIYGGKPPLFVLAGTRIEVISFDLERKTARIGVQVRAALRQERVAEWMAQAGQGLLLVLKDGKIVPIPVPGPEPARSDLAVLIRSEIRSLLRAELGGGLARFQEELESER